jgi:molecular chaperone Hsp33
MVNASGGGRCAITLDPENRLPGQQPYQGVAPLQDAQGHKLPRLSDVLQHYMRQSEQLDATLVLAANAQVAAGLLIQRMPVQGQGNLGGARPAPDAGDDEQEDYRRIATLAASLTREELLTLDADALLRRLFWQERLLRFAPRLGADGPRFSCTCSRERVGRMLRQLGAQEVQDILTERGDVQVGCEFCGQQYRFDAVDAARLFTAPEQQPPGTVRVQ